MSCHIAQHHPPYFSCRVLLLIDVQVGMLHDKSGVPSRQSVRSNIERILHCARSEKHPPLIIHVRNSGEVSDPDEPNTPGWHLVFSPHPHEPVVDKRKSNAFEGTNLSQLIHPTAEVIVVGMQSEYCIRATCSAALARGNEVILIRGAHATFDRVEIWNGGTVTKAHVIEGHVEAELDSAGVSLLDMKDVPLLFKDR
ncbi:Isochorismatase-like protein [Pisolithus marmoratus]|nr:Isochorismatase-like protein [Pisolithus marmoratus]